MLTPSDISAASTHDLWAEGRNFKINATRLSDDPTKIELQIIRPIHLKVTNGFIVLLSDKPINANNYPDDGKQYQASTNFADPLDQIPNSGGAKVVAAYYDILNVPMPVPMPILVPDDNTIPVIAGASESTLGYETSFYSTLITVSNTNPNTIYYASVHNASNILQYYAIGVSSYPLSNSEENTLSTYAGNIPSLPTAPLAPTHGMVYHDQQLNIIQFYDGAQGVWIPTRADTIISGKYNPGISGQTYFWSGGSALMVFDGVKWVKCDSTNLQVRVPSTTNLTGWAPVGKVSSNIRIPDTAGIGDFVYDYSIERIQYWDGITWVYPSASNVLFETLTPMGMIPAFVMPMTVEALKLADPYIGQLFYNTNQKKLYAWAGNDWIVANTDQRGATSSEKINIGTDGSYDERMALIKTLQSQLGYPQLCVELVEEQFNIAIDNALDTYRQLSSGAYKNAYILFKLKKNQQTYFLNNPIDKTDHIVSVGKIHRMNILGAGMNSDNVFMQHFLTDYYYKAGRADILSASLMANLSEEFEMIFAGNLTFMWDEATRELMFTRKISQDEKVIIEAMLERPEQELLVDRWCRQFIQNYALAELKMMLGLIRSKFSSGTPGAAGTITLNGELLIAESRQDMTELKQGLLDYEYGGHVGQGNVSFGFF